MTTAELLFHPKNVAKNLREMLEFLDMNQTEFVEKLECTQSAVSQWLSGERVPSLQVICKILTTFNIKCERLVKP